MTTNDVLLQRCFDIDLNDAEMKTLCLELSNDSELRNMFRSFQILQRGLHTIPSPAVPISLDERMKSLSVTKRVSLLPIRSSVRLFATKKLTVSIRSLAMTLLLILIGSYLTATKIVIPTPKTEYVYVVEMQPVIIHSNYSN